MVGVISIDQLYKNSSNRSPSNEGIMAATE